MKSDVITLSVLLKAIDAVPQKDLTMEDVRKKVSASTKLRKTLLAFRKPYEEIEMGAKRAIWNVQEKYAKLPESKEAMSLDLEKAMDPFNEEKRKLDEVNSKLVIDVNLDKNDEAFLVSIFEEKIRPNIVDSDIAVGIADALGIA